MVPALLTVVAACRRHAAWVTLLFLLASTFCGWYAAAHFKMNTDVNTLLAADLPWRQQEKALEQAFPARNDLLVIVVDAPDPAAAEAAAAGLFARMQPRTDLFHTVRRPDALPFFAKNGLLYLDQKSLADVIDRLMQAQPLLGSLAADQSLRGLFRTFELMLTGLEQNAITEEQYAPIFTKTADIIARRDAAPPAKLDWQSLLDPEPDPRQLRRFILAQPVLDYSALSPGAAATAAVRAMIAETGLLTPGASIRLTGPVALNDEEFASVADGMGIAAIGSFLLVVVILLLALRSLRLIIPILLTLGAGLVMTTAFGIAAIGALNLISVAFIVMFIGIAVDFGIQFGVRYRDQHFHHPGHTEALAATVRVVARPLVLAALAAATGFLAFTPTDYAGVAELGLIAGAGMLIALFCNLTLLPALITLFRPPAEREPVGFRWLRPLDNALHRHRKAVIAAALILAVASAAVTTRLRFDFDPLNLKDPGVESVSTLFDLARNLDSTPYTAQILSPSLAEADATAAKLAALPEVARVMTLSSFIPEDQAEKLPLLEDTRLILLNTLTPASFAPAPRAADLQQAARSLHDRLAKLRDKNPAIAALADRLKPLADDATALFKLQDALIGGLHPQLVRIRDLLAATPVALTDLPAELKQDWLTPDGKARIEIYPRENPRDPENLMRFNRALQSVAPAASGTTIAIAESGNTVVSAFIRAAVTAVAAIALLLLVSLRRLFDTLALLAPLILAALLTLATSVLLQIPINFANIIGLPLLLGLGVSFAIYFIIYWQDKGIEPLQSSMARAVIFSAGTTLVAFGALAASAHPGTASMGQILTIALLYALLTTCFLLPALLRQVKPKED